MRDSEPGICAMSPLVSNTLPADLSGAAEAEASDVTAHSADGGSDDCEKPPARELLGTTTTA